MKVGDRVRPKVSVGCTIGTVVRFGEVGQTVHVQWDDMPEEYFPWMISNLVSVSEEGKSASEYYAAISGELV